MKNEAQLYATTKRWLARNKKFFILDEPPFEHNLMVNEFMEFLYRKGFTDNEILQCVMLLQRLLKNEH